jgi:hypothetical protein
MACDDANTQVPLKATTATAATVEVKYLACIIYVLQIGRCITQYISAVSNALPVIFSDAGMIR